MKNETVLILLVLIGGGYFLFFKKANDVYAGARPAPIGANPTTGNSQEGTAAVVKSALDLISQAFKSFGDNTVAQTSAQRY